MPDRPRSTAPEASPKLWIVRDYPRFDFSVLIGGAAIAGEISSPVDCWITFGDICAPMPANEFVRALRAEGLNVEVGTDV
jgi:hypothetical protein